MAAMSLGAALVAVAFISVWAADFRSIKEIGKEWRLKFVSENPIRLFWGVSIGLAVACALSLFVAWIWPICYGDKCVEVEWGKDLAKLWYLAWPFVLLMGFKKIGSLKVERVLTVWVLAFMLYSCVGIIQYFTGWPKPQLIPSGTWNKYHATAFLGFHLSLASIFIFPFFFSLDRLFRGQVRGAVSVLPKWVYAIGVALGVCVLFATYSRTLWVALPFGIFIYFLLALKKRWLIPLGGIAWAAYEFAMTFHQVRARLADGYGLGTRSELWKINLEFIKERPWTGAGWHHNLELSGFYALWKNPGRNDFFGGHAHNNLLEMLGSTGILGSFFWLFWCFLAILFAWKNRKRVGALGIMCAWLVFHLNGITQVNFWESKVLHQIMFVMAIMMYWRVNSEDMKVEAK